MKTPQLKACGVLFIAFLVNVTQPHAVVAHNSYDCLLTGEPYQPTLCNATQHSQPGALKSNDLFYHDPRWWGVIASILVALFLHFVGRNHADKLFHLGSARNAREDEFIRTVREPIEETLTSLRQLRVKVRNLINMTPDDRRLESEKIYQADATSILNDLMDGLVFGIVRFWTLQESRNLILLA